MTVIAALFSRSCIALSSDSFITEVQPTGNLKVLESQQSKIVPIRRLRAAASYWGLASYGRWSTYNWLKETAISAGNGASLETFANYLRNALEKELSQLALPAKQKGIGIHLTGYEEINGYWVPELFLCSNFKGTDYSSVGDLGLGRHTEPYVLSSQIPSTDYGNQEHRLTVHNKLQEGIIFQFNNGDPVLFNPVAASVFSSFQTLANRGLVSDIDSPATFQALVKRPVEIVSKMQRDFCREGQRIVGGKTHDLVIKSNGEFESTSGDCT
jgi:hypothetical protein